VKEDGSSDSSEEDDELAQKRGSGLPTPLSKDGTNVLQLQKKVKPPVKKSKLEVLKEEMNKITKDFVESSALFEELMSIYRKGERALKIEMNSTIQ